MAKAKDDIREEQPDEVQTANQDKPLRPSGKVTHILLTEDAIIPGHYNSEGGVKLPENHELTLEPEHAKRLQSADVRIKPV